MNDYKIARIIQIKNIVLIICATGITAALFKMSGGSWHSLWALGLFIFYSAVKIE